MQITEMVNSGIPVIPGYDTGLQSDQTNRKGKCVPLLVVGEGVIGNWHTRGTLASVCLPYDTEE